MPIQLLVKGQSLLRWVREQLLFFVLFASESIQVRGFQTLNRVLLFSLVAATTEERNSIFGVYLWAGTVVMLIPCLKVSLAQRAFEVIVYMSIACSVVWIGVRAGSILKVVGQKRD